MDDTTTPRRRTEGRRVPLRYSLTVLHGPGRPSGERLPLPAAPVVLGRRAQPGGIGLEDGSVSRHHATLLATPSGLRLVDSSTNGCFVETERVSEATLEDGALLRVGDTFLMVRTEGEGAEADAVVPELVGDSPPMRHLREEIALVGASDVSVLVAGPSGTGKELVAAALHRVSGRRSALVRVNCAAIPEALAESHLFGHVAGAFTGAAQEHDGLLRRAHGGTLFLDEIAELALPLQAKLLRATEERAITPVGARRPVPIDVRFLSATHRDLSACVRAGTFRGDLLARISDVTLRTPPLASRREDVLPLFCRALETTPDRLAPELVEALLVYPWPFNVRELIKVAAELGLRSRGEPRLVLSMIASRLARNTSAATDDAGDEDEGRSAAERADAPSDDEVRRTFAEHGTVAGTARALGRSRRQVSRYLQRLGLVARAGDGA